MCHIPLPRHCSLLDSPIIELPADLEEQLAAATEALHAAEERAGEWEQRCGRAEADAAELAAEARAGIAAARREALLQQGLREKAELGGWHGMGGLGWAW